MAASVVPHRYPFRLVDRRGDDCVVAALTLDAALWRGGVGPWPLPLAVELMAQASLLLLIPGGGEAAGSGAERSSSGGAEPAGMLAGIEDARMRAELRPGDRLEARAELERRLGPVVRVRARLEREGEEVASASLLLLEGGFDDRSR